MAAACNAATDEEQSAESPVSETATTNGEVSEGVLTDAQVDAAIAWGRAEREKIKRNSKAHVAALFERIESERAQKVAEARVRIRRFTQEEAETELERIRSLKISQGVRLKAALEEANYATDVDLLRARYVYAFLDEENDKLTWDRYEKLRGEDKWISPESDQQVEDEALVKSEVELAVARASVDELTERLAELERTRAVLSRPQATPTPLPLPVASESSESAQEKREVERLRLKLDSLQRELQNLNAGQRMDALNRSIDESRTQRILEDGIRQYKQSEEDLRQEIRDAEWRLRNW